MQAVWLPVLASRTLGVFTSFPSEREKQLIEPSLGENELHFTLWVSNTAKRMQPGESSILNIVTCEQRRDFEETSARES